MQKSQIIPETCPSCCVLAVTVWSVPLPQRHDVATLAGRSPSTLVVRKTWGWRGAVGEGQDLGEQRLALLPCLELS